MIIQDVGGSGQGFVTLWPAVRVASRFIALSCARLKSVKFGSDNLGMTGLTASTGTMEMPCTTPLDMAFLPGRGDTLVVSLSGVGPDYDAPPPFELVGTASDGGRNHVLMISDPLRCWMNHPGCAAELKRVIEETAETTGVATIVAVGNSMGAFMAIRLAEITRVDIVIGLSPQFSVQPELMPTETRWMRFRKGISDWICPDVGAMRAEGTAYYVFHGDTPDEKRHWSRFPRHARLHHYILFRGRHNIAVALKKSGVLLDTVRAAILNRPRQVRRVLQSQKGRRFTPTYRAQLAEAA